MVSFRSGEQAVLEGKAARHLDGRPSETVTKLAEQDRDTTVAEDVGLVNSVQRGLSRRGYRAAPLVIDPDHGVNSEHSIR